LKSSLDAAQRNQGLFIVCLSVDFAIENLDYAALHQGYARYARKDGFGTSLVRFQVLYKGSEKEDN